VCKYGYIEGMEVSLKEFSSYSQVPSPEPEDIARRKWHGEQNKFNPIKANW